MTAPWPWLEQRVAARLAAGATVTRFASYVRTDMPGSSAMTDTDVFERALALCGGRMERSGDVGATCATSAPKNPLATPSAGLADFLAAALSRPTPDSTGKRA